MIKIKLYRIAITCISYKNGLFKLKNKIFVNNIFQDNLTNHPKQKLIIWLVHDKPVHAHLISPDAKSMFKYLF